MKRSDRERDIKENITKKHVKVVCQKLTVKTIEHELQMRRLIPTLEKHPSIFESVEQMGMPRADFIDGSIEIVFENLWTITLRNCRI